jgi:hypothetical protein
LHSGNKILAEISASFKFLMPFLLTYLCEAGFLAVTEVEVKKRSWFHLDVHVQLALVNSLNPSWIY